MNFLIYAGTCCDFLNVIPYLCIQSSERYSQKNVEKFLMGKGIVIIFHFEEISDLVVEFEAGIYLELVHDSNYFEGWQLTRDNEFYLIFLPGGSYSNY